MNYEAEYQRDVLIIKLSGTVGSNERLLSRNSLLSLLKAPCQKIIVDLSGLRMGSSGFWVGVLNTLKKEVQFRGGKVKICSLPSGIARHFQEKRLDQMFDIEPTLEVAKKRFSKEPNERG